MQNIPFIASTSHLSIDQYFEGYEFPSLDVSSDIGMSDNYLLNFKSPDFDIFPQAYPLELIAPANQIDTEQLFPSFEDFRSEQLKLSNTSECKFDRTSLYESNLSKKSKKISKVTPNSSETDTHEILGRKNKKKHWQPHEDDLVRELYAKWGPSWTEISNVVGNRKGKQVRDRYMNYLRPNINSADFSVEEDRILLQLHEQHGNKWRKIAELMLGRTESQVKNRYYVHLRNSSNEARTSFDSPTNREGKTQRSKKIAHDIQTLQVSGNPSLISVESDKGSWEANFQCLLGVLEERKLIQTKKDCDRYNKLQEVLDLLVVEKNMHQDQPQVKGITDNLCHEKNKYMGQNEAFCETNFYKGQSIVESEQNCQQLIKIQEVLRLLYTETEKELSELQRS